MGVWGRGPQRDPEVEPLVEEAESFLSIFIQKSPKLKDFSDSVTPCPRQTASCSHDQPLLLVNGGRAPSPSMAFAVSQLTMSEH